MQTLYRFTPENVLIYGDTLCVVLCDGSPEYTHRYINVWTLCTFAGGKNGLIKNGLDQWIPMWLFIEENHGDFLDWLCAEYFNRKEGRTIHRPVEMDMRPVFQMSLNAPLLKSA